MRRQTRSARHSQRAGTVAGARAGSVVAARAVTLAIDGRTRLRFHSLRTPSLPQVPCGATAPIDDLREHYRPGCSSDSDRDVPGIRLFPRVAPAFVAKAHVARHAHQRRTRRNSEVEVGAGTAALLLDVDVSLGPV